MVDTPVIHQWIFDGRAYRLTMWDTGRTDSMGKVIVRYAFATNEGVIFAGEDFHCSPLHAWDSDQSAGSLLAFLTLGKGDTDEDYFDSYTPEQIAFRDEDPFRELLACEAMALEGLWDSEDV